MVSLYLQESETVLKLTFVLPIYATDGRILMLDKVE